MPHLDDRWMANGKPSARHGHGSRYRVRWADRDGAERSRSFADPGDAQAFLAEVESALCSRLAEQDSPLCAAHRHIADFIANSREGRFVIPAGRCVHPARTAQGLTEICGAPGADDEPLPLCAEHRGARDNWVAERVAELDAAREAEEARRTEEEEARWNEVQETWRTDTGWIVYYLLRSDGLIKIGTSRRPNARFRQLRGEHGPLDLLMSHGGEFERERATHRRFKNLWVAGEWFRPGSDLLSFILEVRRKPENSGSCLPGTVPLDELPALFASLAAEPAA